MNTIIVRVLQISKELNVEIYLVGGTIRDLLLNRRTKDLDLVTVRHSRLLAEKVADILRGTFVELDDDREIYRVVLKDKILLDFSKMRGNTIEEDLYERDFTINAMAYNLRKGWPLNEGAIIDPFNGVKDLYNKTIRHMQDKVFREDPLRMLRVPRFMCQLDFDLDRETKKLIESHSHLITNVAGERIAEELFKILDENKAYYYFHLMDKQLNLLEKIFPEIVEMKKIGECKYHVLDSWTHSIYTMKEIESYIYAHGFFEDHIREAYEEHTSHIIAGNHSRLHLLKLGALFHDVGKPSVQKVDVKGRVRFKGHEITGAKLAKEYGDKLKLSVKEKELLYKYVALHMWPLVLYKKNDVSGKSLYEMFNETGKETLDILLIALADIVATRRVLNSKEEMGMFKVHIEYIANNYLTRYKPIENISKIIKGREIMEALNIPEGVIIGKMLEEIRKAIYLGEIVPTKEAVLTYIKEIY
ncbi:CCA tRNA nucleotidyltransferase [Anaerovirgula multivorans]|nr:HDIG domain-containing metalloprotein [Anaerovirgula multivorans]